MGDPISVYLMIGICSLLGFALLIAEMFLPGFGLPGISGIVLELIGIVIAFVNRGATFAVIVTVLLLALDAAALTIALHSIRKGRLSKTDMVLKEQEDAAFSKTESEEMAVFLGKKGKALTSLHPVGIVDLDGVRLDASSRGEYIAKDAQVKVIHSDGQRIIVAVDQ